MKYMIRLNCDYLEGCHPSILEKLTATNLEQTPGYGTDHYCKEAADAIREAFSCRESAVHFLVGGTQANMTVIAAALRPYEGVLCAETGHINVHETGAIESTGHKCLALPHKDGLIAGSQVAVAAATQADDEHTVRPGMVYISMSTEVGTVYNRSQLKDLYDTCKQLGLYLFIDGARLGYGLAAPTCDLTPADIAKFSDVFTVGGTKMGALFGEAVVINNPELNVRFRYMIKQKGGMFAKGRLMGVQFEEMMKDGLYMELSEHASRLGGEVHNRAQSGEMRLQGDKGDRGSGRPPGFGRDVRRARNVRGKWWHRARRRRCGANQGPVGQVGARARKSASHVQAVCRQRESHPL